MSQYLLREAGALLGARTERGTRDRRVDRAFDRRAADDSGAQAGDLDREDLITVFPSFVGTDASPVVMPEPPWRLPLHNAPPRLATPPIATRIPPGTPPPPSPWRTDAWDFTLDNVNEAGALMGGAGAWQGAGALPFDQSPPGPAPRPLVNMARRMTLLESAQNRSRAGAWHMAVHEAGAAPIAIPTGPAGQTVPQMQQEFQGLLASLGAMGSSFDQHPPTSQADVIGRQAALNTLVTQINTLGRQIDLLTRNEGSAAAYTDIVAPQLPPFVAPPAPPAVVTPPVFVPPVFAPPVATTPPPIPPATTPTTGGGGAGGAPSQTPVLLAAGGVILALLYFGRKKQRGR